MVYVWNGSIMRGLLILWSIYIYIYKGYGFVGFLIISYYYDMRVK